MNISRSKKHMYLIIVMCLTIIGLAAVVTVLAYDEQRRIRNASQDDMTSKTKQQASNEPGDSRSDIIQTDPDNANTPPLTDDPKTDQNETTPSAPARVKEGVDGAQQQ